MNKLNDGHKHLLRLIAKEQANPSGWAKVSDAVYPLVAGIPEGLVELRKDDSGWYAMLTSKGCGLVDAMAYL